MKQLDRFLLLQQFIHSLDQDPALRQLAQHLSAAEHEQLQNLLTMQAVKLSRGQLSIRRLLRVKKQNRFDIEDGL